VLAYDYYPFFDPPARLPDYLRNFAIARRVAAEAHVPLWFYPAIVAGPPAWLPPTAGRLRFQVAMALAHGARGLLHFTYCSDQRAPRDVVRQVNREAIALVRAVQGRQVSRVEHRRTGVTVARFGDDRALVVNWDVERARELRLRIARRSFELALPAGAAEVVSLDS
jgi:hypothetical protein